MGYLVLLVDKRHMFGASYQSYTLKKNDYLIKNTFSLFCWNCFYVLLLNVY